MTAIKHLLMAAWCMRSRKAQLLHFIPVQLRRASFLRRLRFLYHKFREASVSKPSEWERALVAGTLIYIEDKGPNRKRMHRVYVVSMPAFKNSRGEWVPPDTVDVTDEYEPGRREGYDRYDKYFIKNPVMKDGGEHV